VKHLAVNTTKNDKLYPCIICNGLRAKDSQFCPHWGTQEVHKNIWIKRIMSLIFWILIFLYFVHVGIVERLLDNLLGRAWWDVFK